MTFRNEPMPRPRRSYWVLFLSVILAALFLFIALSGIDWNVFIETLRNGNYEILLLTIPLASFNYFVRAVRWSVLVRSDKPVPLRSVFWANMVGYMGNTFLPARAGELLRSTFLGRKSGLGMSFILATALVERVLDTIALVLIGSICLLGQGNMPAILTDALRVVALIGVASLVVLLIAPFQKDFFLNLLEKLPLPARLADKSSAVLERFLYGMRSLQNVRRLGMFVILTGIVWLLDALANMIGVHIISQSLTLGQALIFLSALGLSSAIPATPGYIGIYQFVAVLVLVPFGFSRADAFAYILISQVTTLLIVGFWGIMGLWRISADSVTVDSTES